MPGFGIIGCGMIAGTHCDAISHLTSSTLVGVYDFNSEAGHKFALERNTRFFNTVEEMLKCSEVDIVCICTPSGLHAKYAIQSLMAGKNVVVEKPMALTTEDCDKIIEAEKESGKVCAVISQLRFSDMSGKVRSALESGELGKIAEVGLHMKYHRDSAYYDTSPWKGTWAMDGGGALMNQGIHGVDLLISFLGMPKSVFAFCKTMHHNIEVEDTAVAVLEFENGPIGIIEATTSITPGNPRRLEISGTEGSIIIEENTIKSWDTPKEKYTGETNNFTSYNDPSVNSYMGHLMEFEDVIAAIESGTKPLVNTAEGKKSVQLIRAIYKSSETGQKIYL